MVRVAKWTVVCAYGDCDNEFVLANVFFVEQIRIRGSFLP